MTNSHDNKERKVLLVCDNLGGRGGAERQMVLLARSLPRGWKATVWSMEGGRSEGDLDRAEIPYRTFRRKFAKDPRPIVDLFRYTRSQKPDVVHSWGWMSALTANVVCRLCRVPHLGGMIRRGTLSGRRTWIVALTARLGDRIVANSQAGLSAYKIPPEKGRVIHNGFDVSRLQFHRPDKKAAPGPTTIVKAATLDDRKDFESFIKAARILSEARASSPRTFRFIVIGDGPSLSATQQLSGDLVADGTVVFTGRVPEVTEHLAQADVGVLMSTGGEGFSNSIMEYMACGLPVICSDSGGNRELVIDEVTGFLIPPFDAENLAEKIQWLRANPDRAAEMGAAGRQRIVEEFSTEKMVVNTLRLYDELLG